MRLSKLSTLISIGFFCGIVLSVLHLGNTYTVQQTFVGYSGDHFDCVVNSNSSYTDQPQNAKLTNVRITLFNPSNVDVNYTIYTLDMTSGYNPSENVPPIGYDLYKIQYGTLRAKQTTVIAGESFRLLDNYLITGFTNDTSVALIITTVETFTVYRF